MKLSPPGDGRSSPMATGDSGVTTTPTASGAKTEAFSDDLQFAVAQI